MKRLVLLMAALAAVSCLKGSLDDVQIDSAETFELSFTASAPDSSVDTRTQIADGLSVVWNASDEIKVCFPVNLELYNNSGLAISGASGVFASSSEDKASSAEFVCDSWEVDLDAMVNGKPAYNSVGYAFYPASVTFSHNVPNYSSADIQVVSSSYVIPSEQNAVEGSFDKDINPSYAVISREELLNGTANVVFRNLAALVRINLSDNIDNVKEIRINTANAGASTVCGTMDLNISYDNAAPGITTSLQKTTDATPVILRRNDGQNLQAGQTYYAVIAPGRTHIGLKLTFVSADGAEVEKVVNFGGNNWAVEASDCLTVSVQNPIVFPEATVLELDTESFEASYAAASKEVNVTANYAWTVSSDSDWLTVSPSSGSESGKFTMTIAENNAVSARSAQVTVTSGKKTKTITVTQANKVYHVVSQITKAEDIENGCAYVIAFVDNSNYYWHVDAYGYLSRGYMASPDQGFTTDFVYQFETIDGYDVGTPWENYGSAATGVLKSLMNGLYLDYYYLCFTLGSKYETDPGFYVPIIMASNYDGASTYDIEFINWWDSSLIYYYPDGNFYLDPNFTGSYKWYMYKVEVE